MLTLILAWLIYIICLVWFQRSIDERDTLPLIPLMLMNATVMLGGAVTGQFKNNRQLAKYFATRIFASGLKMKDNRKKHLIMNQYRKMHPAHGVRLGF